MTDNKSDDQTDSQTEAINSSSSEKLLSANELAKYLGVSKRTIMRYCQLGILPPPIVINSHTHRYNLRLCLEALKERSENMLAGEIKNAI